ncbi:MAG: 4-hydroxyphenylpyruvate dioxygenase [Gammaproteobacteria bacterium]
MAHAQDNPLGTDGFEFVEFAAADPRPLRTLFEALGFQATARHRRYQITRYEQGGANLLLNEEPGSFASSFTAVHGPAATSFAIRVKDARQAFARAVALGAKPADPSQSKDALSTPVIEGVGGSRLYLVERYGRDAAYEKDFEPLSKGRPVPSGHGIRVIDHLTHNVERGEMDTWSGFYERIFNFHEVRYFDIKGMKTGLFSRAMTSPDGRVRIPINESADDKSQIAEYLRAYRGAGIQHIALGTENIYETVEAMRHAGIRFLDTPAAYYEMVPERIPHHGEDVKRLEADRLLIDADPEDPQKILLQIFTEPVIGPIFFEIIERKGNEGFGEGNFRALFLAMERDQERRGQL